MGLIRAIHDTVVAADLMKAANTINEGFKSNLLITAQYGDSMCVKRIDYARIKNNLDNMEERARFMYKRMQDLAPENRVKTTVTDCFGHIVPIFGYVLGVLDTVQQFRIDLGNVDVIP